MTDKNIELPTKAIPVLDSIRKKFPECKWTYNRNGNCYEGSNGWIIRWCAMGDEEDSYRQLFIYKNDRTEALFI